MEPQRLMLNSIYSSLVGEEVMEKIASPLPGTERIAHCPGRCSNNLPPPTFSTRKVFTSAVSVQMSVITPIWGIKVSW